MHVRDAVLSVAVAKLERARCQRFQKVLSFPHSVRLGPHSDGPACTAPPCTPYCYATQNKRNNVVSYNYLCTLSTCDWLYL